MGYACLSDWDFNFLYSRDLRRLLCSSGCPSRTHFSVSSCNGVGSASPNLLDLRVHYSNTSLRPIVGVSCRTVDGSLVVVSGTTGFARPDQQAPTVSTERPCRPDPDYRTDRQPPPVCLSYSPTSCQTPIGSFHRRSPQPTPCFPRTESSHALCGQTSRTSRRDGF